MADALIEQAAGRVTGNHRGSARPCAESGLAAVEAQARLARLRIRAVALEAIFERMGRISRWKSTCAAVWAKECAQKNAARAIHLSPRTRRCNT